MRIILPNGKSINFSRIIIVLVILVLSVVMVVFAVKYVTVRKELRIANEALGTQKINDKILNFNKLFIDYVLQAKQEINFETRLKLESAVRAINDKDILAQWEKFTASKTESEAQGQVKDLLDLLINKIKVQ